MAPIPRDVPNPRLECASCDSPVVKTADGEFVCVACGSKVTDEASDRDARADAPGAGRSSRTR